MDSHQKASFLAAPSPPYRRLAACLANHLWRTLDNEAVRIAVALRLGLNGCVPYTCRCGSQVDATGTHGSVHKRAARLGLLAIEASVTLLPCLSQPRAQGKPLTWRPKRDGDLHIHSFIHSRSITDSRLSHGAGRST